MTAAADLQLEQLGDGRWIWIHQTAAGGFYRAPIPYRTKAAARKAGLQWLQRRQDPRNRGR